jgi:isoleucyl-tRNA synthetase
MTDTPAKARDYSETLFLPKTDFPMRAGLPQKEPAILDRWNSIGVYGLLRAAAKGRPRFILHDGPPYANGNIHIGHALNKILKDVVTRSQQMLGFDSNYVPGWDCHGLPIEWKIEEENYRAKGKPKPDFSDAAALVAFRKECRQFAEHWIKVQREEFERLGVVGDWTHPYTTMDFAAEAQIARELMKFAGNGTLYRGSKPVMWSVVEKTALAEAEVEYEDYTSDTVWVKFPIVVAKDQALVGASIVIWTTTPWTIPGNRAISFSPKIEYGLYTVVDAPADNWAKPGERFVLADKLAVDIFRQARVTAFKRLSAVTDETLATVVCSHPLKKSGGYDFAVPLLAGDHVTDDTGTGFVHTAPGHGREDFDVWTANAAKLAARGINTNIPYTVDADGRFTDQAPGFTGKRVLTDKGEKGDANEAVLKVLTDNGMMIARSRLKHQYPHSWRSKKPVIFRNTPQWFIAMDKDIAGEGDTLRHRALEAIKVTRWVPAQGENRINGMIESRPDWVISRQRAWGVPITVFVREKGDGSAEVLLDEQVNERVAAAFEIEGADAWYAQGARERFLGSRAKEDWQKVDDILDVWFDSGSTHAFVLEDPKVFPALAHIKRKADGGPETVMYLEGSDQHRGWFQSSLLESCGTRGRAPFDVVLTHGFVLDEAGYKMSKSLGNVTAPQDVIKHSGADILRMWVCAADYADDLRIGPEILKTTVETYRKLRNTLRWMLGSLAADAASARRARSAGPRGLRRVRLQAHLRRAERFHDYRSVGVLFRYPQRRALLRPLHVGDAQGLPHSARSSVPRHRDVAGADALLHRRGSMAGARSGGTVGASARLHVRAAILARRRFGRAMAQVAQHPPRRHRRARARTCSETHRLLARSGADRLYCRHRLVRRRGRCRSRRAVHHLGGDPGRGRGTGNGVPARRCARRCGGAAPRRGQEMRALLENLARGRRRSEISRRHAARRPSFA